MNLRQIEVFYAVYSTGSVSKAARTLNVSQPSVSKVLRHTEDILGVQLFERAGGKLTPTKEARDLFKSAARVQSEVDRMNSRVQQIRDSRGTTIRIAMTPGIGLTAGPTALANFRGDFPEVVSEVETLHFEGAVDSLLEGRTDLAIVYEPFPHPGIKQVRLAEGEFVCVSKRSISQRKKISVNQLNGQKYISLNSQAPLGKLLNNYLEQHVPNLIEEASANTYHIAKSLAAKGVGIAIVDEITAKSPPADNLEITYFTDPVKFSVTAIYQESRLLSQSDRQFLLRMEEALADLLV